MKGKTMVKAAKMTAKASTIPLRWKRFEWNGDEIRQTSVLAGVGVLYEGYTTDCRTIHEDRKDKAKSVFVAVSLHRETNNTVLIATDGIRYWQVKESGRKKTGRKWTVIQPQLSLGSDDIAAISLSIAKVWIKRAKKEIGTKWGAVCAAKAARFMTKAEKASPGVAQVPLSDKEWDWPWLGPGYCHGNPGIIVPLDRPYKDPRTGDTVAFTLKCSRCGLKVVDVLYGSADQLSKFAGKPVWVYGTQQLLGDYSAITVSHIEEAKPKKRRSGKCDEHNKDEHQKATKDQLMMQGPFGPNYPPCLMWYPWYPW